MKNSFSRNMGRVWKKFRKQKSSLFALVFLVLLILAGLFSDFLASDQPIYQRNESGFYLNPPIPWAPDQPDPLNRDFTGPFDEQKYKTSENNIISSPLRYRHILGTDAVGNDLLSGLIHGASTSLKIGFLSMFIAGIIGLFLGSMAGYFGNDTLQLSRGSRWMTCIGLLMGLFWSLVSRKENIKLALASGTWETTIQILISLFIVIASVFIFFQLGKTFHFIPFFNKKSNFPLDDILQGFSGIFNAIPYLVLILAMVSIFHEKGIGIIVAIIGLTSWTGVYRLTRAELMRIRNLPYIEAAKVYGLSDLKIIWKHAIPNAFTPVLVELTFLIPMAITTESSLSFLGIGMPDRIVTWGSLLNSGRQQFDAWWMVVFPGLALMLTIMSFILVGEGIKKIHKKSV